MDKDKQKKNSDSKSPGKMTEKSPQKPRANSGKGVSYEVALLDGERMRFEIDKNAEGKELLDKVCQHLDLQERDYFGIQYVDERLPQHLKCWLSPDKKISKQKKRGPFVFDFALKFYPPDPTQLKESLTRWLVVLQVRRDILSGKLPATYLTQAMLGSYLVQSDIGDYDPNEHIGIEYVKDIPFAPNQTPDLLEKIVELHRQHKGQTPDEADLNFLENAKKLSMYGVDLHAAQDANNVDIMLGVCASGLQVYREKLRISRFIWPKILKISYKRKHFYIKIRPSENNQVENTVSFKLASHRLAKRLWKICVEHHAFFRLREAEQMQNSALFPRLGSKFRYSGRTLFQARHSSQNLDRPDPYFERSQAVRNTVGGPPTKAQSVDELRNRPTSWKGEFDDDKKHPDGRDKRDHKGQPTPISQLGLQPGSKGTDGKNISPGDEKNKNLDAKDLHDRLPDEGTGKLQKEYDNKVGLHPGDDLKKLKEDEKERKKREKEEEKRRKKEEEERRKKEEEERKKKEEEEKKKKKGKGKDTPDRTDALNRGDHPELAGRVPGSYADDEGGLRIGPGYGGSGIGAGELSGVVGKESWIDNKMSFVPIPAPEKGTKDTLKSGLGTDHTLPFFSPAATSTVGRPSKVPPPVAPKHNSSYDDAYSKTDIPPTVATESVQYNPDLEEVPVPTRNVPIVKTETRTVTYEREGFPFPDSEDGVLVSSSSHSTRMQTIETTTYKTEKDGIQETRVEHKVVLSSTDDDFDYDAALADAIRSVTEFNPDMSVERIECVQQIEEVRDK